jgi:predicted heme/steroid binding protein
MVSAGRVAGLVAYIANGFWYDEGMNTQAHSRIIPWLLGGFVSAVTLMVWLSGLGVTGLNGLSLFPLFGLLAWSIMWTHYVYGVMMVRFGYERNRLYQKISTKIVFACLWLHPGILIYQLWASNRTLPPSSLIDYMGQANTMLLIGAIVAWLTFLSFDVLIKFKKRPFWQKHWWWVSVSQAFAMAAIYGHAIKLGRHIQVDWFKAYWAALGLILVPSIVYLLWNELSEASKLKQGIRRVMKNSKLLGIIAVIGIVVVGAGAYMMLSRGSTETTSVQSESATQSTDQQSSGARITLAQVEQNDGKNGAKCWVIVDTTVYEISGFAQWVDGVHTSSGGVARCGKDQTDIIGDSPHGRSVLRLLKNVGTYQQ